MSGRPATVNVIPGRFALSVGAADMPCPPGWTWTPLEAVARLESGHTPSRNHPEYWDGDVPWIGIKDARIHHGGVITSTLQTVTQAGLDNSAARLLPRGTVCLSRTASVGYVVVMGTDMATSQDFVNWVCGPALDPHFLKLLLIAEHESLLAFGKGTTHTTIYFPEVKAFHVCLPPLTEQQRIVAKAEALASQSRRTKESLDAVPPLLDKLRQSILAAAFRGDLTADWRAKNPDVEPADKLLARTPPPTGKSTGRNASISVRAGRAALGVGPQDRDLPTRWTWVDLSRVAKLESGHTPSRSHPEYWDGGVPWIGIKDAREHHGRQIASTFQTVSQLGLDNSAARLLPPGTVCLSRTASVGYVTVMARSMATSQDFANWICTAALLPEYLMFALLAEGEHLLTFGEGSTHTTIYYPALKALQVALPPLAEQHAIVASVKDQLTTVERLESLAAELQASTTQLDPAILAKAFRGELIPQDPNDEPAAVLLDRIRNARGNATPTPRSTRTPPRTSTEAIDEPLAPIPTHTEPQPGPDAAALVEHSVAALWLHGPLDKDAAVRRLADHLRDAGLATFQRLHAAGPLYTQLADAIDAAVKAGHLDRPKRGQVRACKPDATAYTADDWRHALVTVLGPSPTDRDDAIRAAAEWARDNCGLEFTRLRADGHIITGLRSALNSAIRAKLITRIDATRIARAPDSPADRQTTLFAE